MLGCFRLASSGNKPGKVLLRPEASLVWRRPRWSLRQRSSRSDVIHAARSYRRRPTVSLAPGRRAGQCYRAARVKGAGGRASAPSS